MLLEKIEAHSGAGADEREVEAAPKHAALLRAGPNASATSVAIATETLQRSTKTYRSSRRHENHKAHGEPHLYVPHRDPNVGNHRRLIEQIRYPTCHELDSA